MEALQSAEVEDLRRNWDQFGRRDPVRSINSGLVSDDWDELFRSGEQAIAGLFEQASGFGIRPAGGAALDFGCGAGRLTQALARRFDRVVGTDVAPSMIALAERFNAHPGRCEYVLNVAPDLSFLADGSFDFCCSLLVLQHIPADLAAAYIGEMVRVLRPGGVAAFQAPTRLRPGVPWTAAPLGGPNPYRAVLKRPAGAERRLVADAGARPFMSVEVVVKNESSTAWQAEHRVRLGKRWLTAPEGRVLEPADDGTRTLLPGALEPGAEIVLTASIELPPSPGDYLLELDLVQDGVTWFRQHGSPTLVLPVTVIGASPEASTRPPRMLMGGLARERVVDVVTRAAGALIAAVDDESAGPEFESLLYLVRKS